MKRENKFRKVYVKGVVRQKKKKFIFNTAYEDI